MLIVTLYLARDRKIGSGKKNPRMHLSKINVFVFLKKEVARGGERTRVLSISFIFSFFTTILLSHSGSPRLLS
jgi:hypothetical protein